MKKLLLSALIAVSAISATYAQDSTRTRQHRPRLTAEQRAERSSAALAEKLSLSAEQKKKIYNIELDRTKRLQTTLQSQEDRNAKSEERKALMQDTKSKIDAVLTTEQRTKLQSLRAEQRDKMRKHAEAAKGKRKFKKSEITSPVSGS
ncbi:hypothetical protein [Pedobacter sp. SYP-B3415]|uniref:hypothetical protein n=1 Tax=Pedobacter sp. SYP-B3415 TaxID=2496641 RepID=UPI00101DD5E6|nr:hypothetical protein [Pedobacter sp. SYP-B3415]